MAKREFVGTLYIIGMPLGNSEDITLRSLRILREVDAVLCEDTRRTGRLLKEWQIQQSLIPFHAHNQKDKAEQIIGQLQRGQTLALVTDGGTPAVSDPGTWLVYKARQNQIPVIPLPGAAAPVTAYSVSGFPPKPTVFLGFLSPKKGKRRKELEKWRIADSIVILFESPFRIRELLDDVREIWGNVPVFVGREMTKDYESYYSGKIDEILPLWERERPKGELTLVFYLDFIK